MHSGIPAQIVNIAGLRAKASVKGIIIEISVQLLDKVEPDDYVLIHAGFAIGKINTAINRETVLHKTLNPTNNE